MKTAAHSPANARATPSFLPMPNGLVQRTCTCGAEAGAESDHHFSRVQVHSPAPAKIQTQLRVNAPGDKYEQEADRVADEVMRMPDPASSVDAGFPQHAPGPSIQRKCAACEEEELQRQPAEEEEELQAKELPGHTPVVTPRTQAQINTSSDGQPLPKSVRAFYEPRFGVDFSRTRIHTGSVAAETTRSLSARAFTLGRDIFFNSQEFQPGTASGARLLAHELTHVVQQGKGARHHGGTRERGSSTAAPNQGPRSWSLQQRVSATQPAIMRLSFDNFKTRLGLTPEMDTVITELFDHTKFKPLWDWLGNCKCQRGDHGPIKLRVRRTFDGVQTFGGFDQKRGILTINAKKREARENPQELVDTIVHEVFHAISWALYHKLCPGQGAELRKLLPGFGPELDIATRPSDWSTFEELQLRKDPCDRLQFATVDEPPTSLKLDLKGGRAELQQFERSGPSASDPCTMFQDLHEEPQAMIVGIVDDIRRQTDIGGPTRTHVIQILREEIRRTKQEAGDVGAGEIFKRAPLLRKFRECRDIECARPRRKRNIDRCFKEVLSPGKRGTNED